MGPEAWRGQRTGGCSRRLRPHLSLRSLGSLALAQGAGIISFPGRRFTGTSLRPLSLDYVITEDDQMVNLGVPWLPSHLAHRGCCS